MISPVVHNYALAMVQLASSKGSLNQVRECAEVLTEHLAVADVKLFLESPRVRGTIKREFLQKLLPEESPQEFLNFLNLTVDRGYGGLLPDILAKVIDYSIEAVGYEIITVITSEPLEEAEQEQIRSRLEEMWETRLFPRYRVNPGVIGGLIVMRGDKLYDGSLAGQLQNLRQKMLMATE